MPTEDAVLCVLTAAILFFTLLGLPAGAFSRIPFIGRMFPSPPSPPSPPFHPESGEFSSLQQAAGSLMEVVDLLKGVNGFEAQQNLLREVRDNVQVLVAGLDGIKQDFAKEVHDNVQVLVAGLDEIKQLAERAATLLERGVIGPRELPYLKEVIAHLKAGVDSLQYSYHHSRRAYKLRQRKLTLLRRPSGPGH